ncbi:hypothetical protein JCM1841_002069 [Sporobolomyces salmonicolor]
MGNSQSSSSEGRKVSTASGLRSRSSTLDSNARTIVDGGFLEPQSLLYAHVEYHRPTVHRLILERKLSPFFLGLNDFEDDWDTDRIVVALGEAEQQATQNLKDAHTAASEAADEAEAAQLNCPPGTRKHKEAVQTVNAAVMHRERLAEVIKMREKRGGGGLQWSSKTDQAKLYQGRAVECPICFLYYPPSMVHTRCCDQPICTECFVQIKRADATPTHLESEPAACPFCMEPNFGCVYPKPTRPTVQASASGGSGSSTDGGPAAQPKLRRKSFAHTEKEVVTTDMIHPDWEAKLEAMKATVARRANRRIVFRQVGDRLIPVGITSGRTGDGANATMSTTTLPPNFLSQIAAAIDSTNENGAGRSSRRGSRGRRRGGNDEVAHLLESLGLGGGPDLEEMMIQEAMRLSQLDEEERQKKSKAEEEAKAKQQNGQGMAGESLRAETSAQGAARPSPETTERLLTEAMGGTLGPDTPLQPTSTTFPIVPSAPRPSAASPPSSNSARRGDASSVSSLSGPADSLGIAAASPRSPLPVPAHGEPMDGSSVSRGIVGPGATTASSSRALPVSSSSPSFGAAAPITTTTLPPIPHISLDLPSTPTDASAPTSMPFPSLASLPLPETTSTPAPVSSTSTSQTLPFDRSLDPLAQSSSSSDTSSVIQPSQSEGYEPLADDSDEDGPKGSSIGEHVEASVGRLVDL